MDNLLALLALIPLLLILYVAFHQIYLGLTVERAADSFYINTHQAFEKGLRFEALGSSFEAMSLFLQVVQAEPEWAEARYHLGRAYFQLNDYDKAREQRVILSTLNPDLAAKLGEFLTLR